VAHFGAAEARTLLPDLPEDMSLSTVPAHGPIGIHVSKLLLVQRVLVLVKELVTRRSFGQ
jgi:hypothetical protein